MTTYALPLIDKDDNFQKVGVRIASILATETAAQQLLATAAEKDPALWALRVFHERSNPWDSFINADSSTDTTPIVNVWYDGGNPDASASTVNTRQKVGSRYNIDCLTYAVSKSSDAGHDTGDKLGTLAAQRAAKIVRNILMSDKYKYLGFDTDRFISRRWIASISAYPPSSGSIPVQNVTAIRLTLEVDHNETTDLPAENTIELINIKQYFDTDGEIIVEMNIPAASEEE